MKNNITRLLDSRKITYTAFELSAEKRGAIETARLLNISVDLVYKTIVLTRKKGRSILVVIPAAHEVNLKKVAKIVGEKKVFLPTQNDAEKLTGLQAGGISPLALINKGFVVILNASVREHENIHISGGQRGLNIRLGVDDLIKLTQAKVGDVSNN
ncbi:MAG: Cys-tRNA(Pro) deacylase [Chloroflexi bacterium]|nr:Cys-tRNA(Pro) deacylase [Chloroflexota bacterium]